MRYRDFYIEYRRAIHFQGRPSAVLREVSWRVTTTVRLAGQTPHHGRYIARSVESTNAPHLHKLLICRSIAAVFIRLSSSFAHALVCFQRACVCMCLRARALAWCHLAELWRKPRANSSVGRNDATPWWWYEHTNKDYTSGKSARSAQYMQ
jgi:hypothetical protein